MAAVKLIYSVLSGTYAICRLNPDAAIPPWAVHAQQFYSITRTPDELSIVWPEQSVPKEAKASRGWMCLKLQGPFAFSDTGILTSFVDPLSQHGIPVFAISTFDTDYVLIEQKSWPAAFDVLRSAGHDHVPE